MDQGVGVGGDHFDIVVVGTAIAESIAAATLARAGYSVLHLDPNEYYGSQHASLTLSELSAWCTATGSICTPISDRLRTVERRYAISLTPAVLPSRGRMIDKLVEMDVGRYVEFKMLDGVLVAQPQPQPPAVTSSSTREQGDGDDGQTAIQFTAVPSSKEAIFKDKSISLVEKRKLMKVLMVAVGGDVGSAEGVKGLEQLPLLDTLRGPFALSDTLAKALSYGIAHCSSAKDTTLSSLVRMSRYLRSIGRYGPSAFLVGKYGGAGEIAQAFCRSCAVHGGTYVLGEQAKISAMRRLTVEEEEGASVQSTEQTSGEQQVGQSPGKRMAITIPAHPREVTTFQIICSDNLPSLRDYGFRANGSTEDAVKYANCIAVYEGIPSLVASTSKRKTALDPDEDEQEQPIDDVLLFVIPPSAVGNHEEEVVRILTMGSGTGSCPDGQCIVYIQKHHTADDLESQFKLYLALISDSRDGGLKPSYEAYHVSTVRQPIPSNEAAVSIVRRPGITAGSPVWLEGLDFEAEEADRLVKATGLEIPEVEPVNKDVEDDF